MAIISLHYSRIQTAIASDPSYSPLYNKSNVGPIIFSGYDVIENKIDKDFSTGQYSMWFSDPAKRTISNLTDQSKRNLELSLNLDLFSYVSWDINSSLVNMVQHAYSDGFLYVHPASNKTNFTTKLIENCPYSSDNPSRIDSRCLKSYQKLKDYYILSSKTSNQSYLFLIPNVRLGDDGSVFGEFCFALLTQTFKFDTVLCIDYNFDGG